MSYQFYHMLLHLSKIAKDAGTEMFKATSVTPGQAWILDVVARFGPIKQAETADILNIKLPAVSRMVKGMVRDGLIHRERNAKDDRIILLSLTELGGEKIPEIREAWSKVETKLLADFSEAERESFKQLMVKAAENFS